MTKNLNIIYCLTHLSNLRKELLQVSSSEPRVELHAKHCSLVSLFRGNFNVVSSCKPVICSTEIQWYVIYFKELNKLLEV